MHSRNSEIELVLRESCGLNFRSESQRLCIGMRLEVSMNLIPNLLRDFASYDSCEHFLRNRGLKPGVLHPTLLNTNGALYITLQGQCEAMYSLLYLQHTILTIHMRFSSISIKLTITEV
jgi:hypothetical protein